MEDGGRWWKMVEGGGRWWKTGGIVGMKGENDGGGVVDGGTMVEEAVKEMWINGRILRESFSSSEALIFFFKFYKIICSCFIFHIIVKLVNQISSKYIKSCGINSSEQLKWLQKKIIRKQQCRKNKN